MSIKPEYLEYLRHLGPTVPVRELASDPQRRDVVALRHDIDHDLDLALELRHHEHAHGMRATYYLLHTHEYWRDDRFLLKCRQLEAYGHEVALHLNVITEWVEGRCDDVDTRLAEILAPLREAGLTVTGVSAHGDRACYEHGFANYWIWQELRGDDPSAAQRGRSAEGVVVDDPKWQVPYPPEEMLTRADGTRLPFWQTRLADHGLDHDAMHVPCDHYWTDTGGGWTRSGDPLEADLRRGRHQVLFHPHWWRGPQRRYYVLSAAHSGSKWLASFVDRATSCRGVHEWTLNHRRTDAGMIADKRTNTDFIGLIEDRRLATALIRQAVAHRRTQRGDALEANVYLEPFLPQLLAADDDAEIIHLHRDARDVVRSILDRDWYDTPGDRRHRVVPVDDWDDLTQFERACWYVRFTNDSIMPFAREQIAFESMVTDPDGLAARLAAWNIVVHPLLAAEEFPRRINATASRRCPPYDEWPDGYRRAFDRICGPTQAALGYDAPETTTATVPPPRRAPGQAEILLDVDPARGDRPAVTARRTVTWTDPDGLHVRTQDGASSAHLLLAEGTWDKMPARTGWPAHPWVYCTCRIAAELPDEMVARVFALVYDASGRRVDQAHIATLRADTPVATAAFTCPPQGARGALALHLGDQPPGLVLTVKSIELAAVPMGERYRATLARPVETPPGTSETPIVATRAPASGAAAGGAARDARLRSPRGPGQ